MFGLGGPPDGRMFGDRVSVFHAEHGSHSQMSCWRMFMI